MSMGTLKPAAAATSCAEASTTTSSVPIPTRDIIEALVQAIPLISPT